MGLKDAIYLLERQGLTVSFSGAETVLSRSVPSGDSLSREKMAPFPALNAKNGLNGAASGGPAD